MKDKKGFTIMELIAAILVLVMLMLIAIPTVKRYLLKGNKTYYQSLEKSLLLAGRDYISDYRSLLPKEMNSFTVIDLQSLQDNKYIDEVLDENEKKCEAKIVVEKTGKNKYKYYSCLKCGDNYESTDEICQNIDENHNVTSETKQYVVKMPEPEIKEYEVEQGTDFLLPYAKAYYKTTSNIAEEKVEPSPKVIDTNVLGDVEVEYWYKGAHTSIKVSVVDKVKPTKPQVVMRHNDENGTVYQGEWFSGNIYQEFNSTDYAKQGLVGSGIQEYQVDTGTGFEVIPENKKITDSNGTHIYKVKSIDKSGNESEEEMYRFHIDKTNPQCELQVTSGTVGANGWYLSNVGVGFKSITEDISDIKQNEGEEPQIDQPLIDSTTPSTGTKVTGMIKDLANNTGSCELTVKTDKEDPTISISPASGIYQNAQNVTISSDDTNWNYMNTQNIKNGSINNNDTDLTTKTKEYSLTHGSYTISGTAYDLSGRSSSTNNTYTIDEQDPTCSLKVTSGTLGSNDWYKSDVTIGWNSTDGTGSNIISSNISQTSITANGTTTVTGTVQDQSGRVGTCSIVIKKDAGTPSCSLKVTGGTLGSNNWYTSNVTVGWNSTNGGTSGLASSSINQTSITSNGTTTVTGTVTNNAGTSNTCTITVKKDSGSPSCSLKVTSGTLGSNNWYTSNVTVGWNSANGSTSGLASSSINQTSITTNGTTTVTGTVVGNNGKSNTCTLTVKKDSGSPSCSLKVTSGTAGSNGWYKSNVTVGWNSTSGSTSGLASSSINQTSITADGTTTVTGSVTSNNGKSNTCTLTVYKDSTTPSCSHTFNTSYKAYVNNTYWFQGGVTVSLASSSFGVSGKASGSNESTTYSTEGTRTFTTTLTSKSGMVGTCSVNVGVDWTRPTVSVSKSGSNVTFTVSDTNLNHWWINVYHGDSHITGPTKLAPTTTSQSVTMTGGGTKWDVYIVAKDHADNSQSCSTSSYYCNDGWTRYRFCISPSGTITGPHYDCTASY